MTAMHRISHQSCLRRRNPDRECSLMAWDQPTQDRHLGVRAPALDRQRSDDLDGHCVGVSGQRFDVGSVAGQNRPAGLGDRDNERVDS